MTFSGVIVRGNTFACSFTNYQSLSIMDMCGDGSSKGTYLKCKLKAVEIQDHRYSRTILVNWRMIQKSPLSRLEPKESLFIC